MTARLVLSLTLAAQLVLVAGCALDDDDLGVLEAELSVSQWRDDVQIPNQNGARQPALAYFNGRLHMVHSGDANPSELWWTSFDGTSWTTNVKIANQNADGAPGLAAFNGRLYLVYKPAGQNRLVMSSTTTGTSWTTPTVTSFSGGTSTLTSSPSLTVFGAKLVAGFCLSTPSGKLLALDTFDGATWKRDTNYIYGDCDGVAIAPIGDELHAVMHLRLDRPWPLDDDHLVYEAAGPLGNVGWRSLGALSGNSVTTPAMVVCNGHVHLVHNGVASPTELRWHYRTTSGTDPWTDDVAVPDQASRAGAGLGCLGTMPVMVHNGVASNRLYASKFL